MTIADNLSQVYGKFAVERTQSSLYDRFPGTYRALVVETNDPLNMYRVCYKCPEMHDFDVKTSDCPWASPAFQAGGKGVGSWNAPCIGDIIWITFEKSHPYGPIWTGFADPTRVRYYKLHSLFQQTQIYVDLEGKPVGTDTIPWIMDYGPQDGRPYSQGTVDRYGNMMVMDMTGFFPVEHTITPAPPGTDAIANAAFMAQMSTPVSNNPDTKMMAMITKYGHYMILGDQGYDWQADFQGNFPNDYDNEKSRQNQLIMLLNENQPKSADDTYDQRRFEIRTGYGSKFEMRDVGWAATGPTMSTARDNDLFPTGATISKFTQRDERWVKFRTKGGHLMQFMDMGNDPSQDLFVRRARIDEIGGDVDQETAAWQGRDARQMRFITRYGYKFVLDDRGTDPMTADTLEAPHGNGALIKGRRTTTFTGWTNQGADEYAPGRVLTPPTIGYRSNHGEDTTPFGFGIDVNEKNELNRLMVYSPKAAAFEINDRYDYIMVCTALYDTLSEPWQYLSENEFATSITMMNDPEDQTYSFKLDRANTYVAIGTPQKQAFEMRDGYNTTNEAFLEARDIDGRGMVLSKALKLSALHDPSTTAPPTKFLVLNDNTKVILIQNLQGKIQIYAQGADVEVKATNIRLDAANDVSINCQTFNVQAGGTNFGVDGSGFGADGPMFAPQSNAVHVGCAPGPDAGSPGTHGNGAPPITPDPVPQMIPQMRRSKNNAHYVSKAQALAVIKGQPE